jgi:hypothetical protein
MPQTVSRDRVFEGNGYVILTDYLIESCRSILSVKGLRHMRLV